MYHICNSGQWQMLEERISACVMNSGDLVHIFLISSTMWCGASTVKVLSFCWTVLDWLFFPKLFNNFWHLVSGLLYVLLQIYGYVTLYRGWIDIPMTRKASSKDFLDSSLPFPVPTLYCYCGVRGSVWGFMRICSQVAFTLSSRIRIEWVCIWPTLL